MAVETTGWTDDAFTRRVLQRVERLDQTRRRRERWRHALPLVLGLLIGAAWTMAFFLGASALRLLVQGVAWLRIASTIERNLSQALLGPFAPLPSIVSLLLLLAAIIWVRSHQPGPSEGLR